MLDFHLMSYKIEKGNPDFLKKFLKMEVYIRTCVRPTRGNVIEIARG